MKHVSLLVAALGFFLSTAQAQYTLDAEKSTIIILGSSNLTDWNQYVDEMDGTIDVEEDEHKISAVSALTLYIPVESIKSGQNAMDLNAYKAMKSDKFPTITFTLKDAEVNGTDIKLVGVFTIAGVEQEKEIHAYYSSTSTLLVLNGETVLKMTEFGIKPPTALMGAMTTKDELSLEFSLVFER